MNPAPVESLIGTWRGCAFPTQETILVFCPDGKGFLFFYWGSIGDPVLDEFDWSMEQPGEVKVTWRILHESDSASDSDKDSCRLKVTSGTSAQVPFQLVSESNRCLRIDLGLHEDFDTPLTCIGTPGSSDTERDHWQQFTKKFDPFGPGRQVWLVDEGGRWQPLPFQVVEAKKPLFNQWRQLGLIVGTLGQVAFLADYGREVVPVPLRIGLHIAPIVLCVALSESDFEATRWTRIARRLQAIGAAAYLLGTLLVVAFALAGLRPRGWTFFGTFILIGSIVSVRMLRQFFRE